MSRTIWTVGHSNRSLEDFTGLLESESLELIADVRRFPSSRKFPHFNRDALQEHLGKLGLEYRSFEALGGRRPRSRSAHSPNTAWRAEAFNAYADHMLSAEFQSVLSQLLEQAERKRTALMCAEALPWRCHRRLIGDWLLAQGWEVLNIIGPDQVRRHTLTRFARIEDDRVIYPAETLFPEDS